MVNTGALMTFSTVRSKFRKRDESSDNAVTMEDVHSENQFKATYVKNYGSVKNFEIKTIKFARTNGSCGTVNGWEFPPKSPSPNIYHHDDESMMASNVRNGFRELKKQFSGHFKRIVSKKETISSIPPELKPQLKAIYVY